jgi:protein-tyrosine phosphatase
VGNAGQARTVATAGDRLDWRRDEEMAMSVGWIDLEGAHNVRDLGGLAAAGGRTRSGVLLRSDALDQLTAADVRRLVDDAGLAHVVDLRSAHERVERGRGPLGATPVRYTEVEVIGPDDLARRSEARAAAFASGLPPARIISDGYVELLELGAPAFGAAFAAIVEPGGSPALVHCAIGKDRTGVLTAVLLDAAGVDRDEIIADYARTGERMAPIIERWVLNNPSTGMSEQLAAFTATAAPETMDQLLVELHERWGGGAAYLVANGQSPDAVETWRNLFIAPD